MGIEAVQNLHNLIDSDPASCVNTTQLLPFSGIYMTSLNFNNPNDHGSIALNITFDSKLNCTEREVISELNEHFPELRILSAFIGNTLMYFFFRSSSKNSLITVAASNPASWKPLTQCWHLVVSTSAHVTKPDVTSSTSTDTIVTKSSRVTHVDFDTHKSKGREIRESLLIDHCLPLLPVHLYVDLY